MNLAPVGVPADAASAASDQDDENVTRGLVGCVVSAHRPTLTGAYRRLMHVEAEKARRAHQRGDVAEWASEFYAAHGAYVETAIRPVVEACCGAVAAARADLSVPESVVDELVHDITQRHLRNSRQTVEAGDVLHQIERWDAARAEATARAELGWITARIIDHHERTEP